MSAGPTSALGEPDNDLVIDDGVTVGPGAMIHGCRIGARSVIEPGAIVCDGSEPGADARDMLT